MLVVSMEKGIKSGIGQVQKRIFPLRELYKAVGGHLQEKRS
jgi:hypothetical protein